MLLDNFNIFCNIKISFEIQILLNSNILLDI
jgi:hypothetical protein